MNFPMIVLLCFVCCLFSCRVTKDRRTLTGIVVMGRTYKRRSKSLEATALEIIVTDTGNTALKLEVPGCKDPAPPKTYPKALVGSVRCV